MIRYYKAEDELDMNNFLNELNEKLNLKNSIIGITQRDDEYTVFYNDWED